MTVIAYKAGTMACDSLWTSGGRVTSLQTKIQITPHGCLMGCAGETDSRDFEEFLGTMRTPADLPKRLVLNTFDADFQALFVFPNREIYLIDTAPIAKRDDVTVGVIRISSPRFAIGSGGKYAMAWLDAGKTAVEAATYACSQDIYCRPPIHRIDFLEYEMNKALYQAVHPVVKLPWDKPTWVSYLEEKLIPGQRFTK